MSASVRRSSATARDRRRALRDAAQPAACAAVEPPPVAKLWRFEPAEANGVNRGLAWWAEEDDRRICSAPDTGCTR